MTPEPTRAELRRLGPPPLLARVHADGGVRAARDRAGRGLPADRYRRPRVSRRRGSMWCNVHGHRHPRIDAAIREQLDRVAHCTSLGMGCDTTVRLAKRLADLAPGNLEHVFFSSDGSSAVEVALKMAFQYWRQCENPQPQEDEVHRARRSVPRRHARQRERRRHRAVSRHVRAAAVRRRACAAARSAPLAGRHAGSKRDAAFSRASSKPLLAAHHDELAAMVIEPLVQCAAGMVMHPPGYLRGVRELTRKYDVLLIADEVAVGIGRTGTMFACEQEDVVPDFLVPGQGTHRRLPADGGDAHARRDLPRVSGNCAEGRTLHHGHTYGGNPLAAAAALASLDVFDEEQTLANLPAKIARLGEHLCRLAEHPHVRQFAQRGLIGALELTPDKATGRPYPADERRAWRVCREALARGVWLRPLGDVLYVMPPLAISMDEIDRIDEHTVAAIDRQSVTRHRTCYAMMQALRYFLLQTRNSDDPMARRKFAALRGCLSCEHGRDRSRRFLTRGPTPARTWRAPTCCCSAAAATIRRPAKARGLERYARYAARDSPAGEADVCFLLGFSGDGPRDGRPMHQRSADRRARHDRIALTDAGQSDPLFGTLPLQFDGQAATRIMSSNCRPMRCCLASSDESASRRFASPASRSTARSSIRSSIAARCWSESSPIRNTWSGSRGCRSTNSSTAAARRRRPIRLLRTIC